MFHYLRQLATKVILRLLIVFAHRDEYEGIELYAVKDEQLFFAHCKNALSIIKQYDAYNFKLIKKYLRKIAYLGFGCNHYNHKDNIFYASDYFADDLEFFASYLTHEATHARFFSSGVPYRGELKERQEMICTNRQYASLSRLIMAKESISPEGKRDYLNSYREWFDEELKRKWWEETTLSSQRNNPEHTEPGPWSKRTR